MTERSKKTGELTPTFQAVSVWQPIDGDLSLVFGDPLTAVGSLSTTLQEEIIWAMKVHTLFLTKQFPFIFPVSSQDWTEFQIS